MRAEERRALLRTTLIAALLAVGTSVAVYFIRSLPVAAQDHDTQFSVLLHRALNVAHTTDATALENDAQATSARDAWLIVAKKYGLDPDALRPWLRRDRVRELNERLAANEKTRAFVVVVSGEHVSVGRALAPIAGVPVFAANDGPLLAPHAEDWIAETGALSLRALNARVLSQGVLALVDRPELCPTSLRVEASHTLGSALDAMYAHAAIAVAGKEAPSLAEALVPVCRRERLARLADMAMRKKANQRLPFTPGFRLDTFERELLEKMQDPAQVSGLGADARAHMNGMVYSETEIDRVESRLRQAVAFEQPLFARDALAEANAWKQVSSATVPADLRALAGSNDAVATASARALCVYENVARSSPQPAIYFASLLDRFTLEDWPPQAERNAMLTALYRAAKMTLPATGVASGVQLAQVATALDQPPPLDPGCAAVTAPQPSPAELERLLEVSFR